MIVPENRLLVLVGATVVPIAAVAGLVPDVLWPCIALLSAIVLVTALDLLMSLSLLEGVQVIPSPLTRLTWLKAGGLEVRIERKVLTLRMLRLALELPLELKSGVPYLKVALPAEAEAALVTWPVTPLRRGKYLVALVGLEVSSRFGLWAIRKRQPVIGEVRVYPNLSLERKNVAALFLHRGGVGIHAQRMVGRGREFEKLREYVAGDAFDEIHWKATARRGHPVTKVFQVERTQQVYVFIDASRLSGRLVAAERTSGASLRIAGGTLETASQDEGLEASTTILERYVTAALIMALAAERQGDHFGLVTFGERVTGFVRARSGRGHFSTCREALYALQPSKVSPNFEDVFTFIRLELRRRALLVFLTSLDEPALAESFAAHVNLISRHHLVLVNQLRPQGVAPLFAAPDVENEGDVYARLGGHLVWQALRELETLLSRKGARLALLENERLCHALVSQYLSIKKRQLL